MIPSEKIGLSQSIQAQVNLVFQKHPLVERVILYGSRAKGNFKPASDIDLMIVAPKMNLNELLKIQDEIDDQLLPYKTDLGLLHLVDHHALIEHVQRVGIDFYLK